MAAALTSSMKAPALMRSSFVGDVRSLSPNGASAGAVSFRAPQGLGRGFQVFARVKKSVEERFGIKHEKNVAPEVLKELGVERWSTWECGPMVTYRHEWKVDELVYISKGSVMVSPVECDEDAYFYQGDLVRFPKWLEADLTFDEDYEQRYKFFAYGD